MKILEKFDQWIFSHVGPTQFVLLVIFFSILGDGTYLIFLKFALATEENLKVWMNQYSWMPNMNIILHNPELMTQMQSSFQKTLNLLIGFVILLNLIGYFYFYRQKNFAIKYIRNLAITGLILGVFAAWEAYGHGVIWTIAMIGIMPLYFVIYRGIKYYYK